VATGIECVQQGRILLKGRAMALGNLARRKERGEETPAARAISDSPSMRSTSRRAERSQSQIRVIGPFPRLHAPLAPFILNRAGPSSSRLDFAALPEPL
jgi:hypothetical protein